MISGNHVCIAILVVSVSALAIAACGGSATVAASNGSGGADDTSTTGDTTTVGDTTPLSITIHTNGTGGTDGNPPCADGVTLCGDLCVDLATDATNCGACAQACADGEVCAAGACQSSCNDGVKSGHETDIDCGGDSCAGCSSGLHCTSAADCLDGVCSGAPGTVCQAPTCLDQVTNGGETDIDCGGGVCPSCNVGGHCTVAADCTSGVCTGGVCQAPPLGLCTIYGGAGLDVLHDEMLETECHAACDAQAVAHPNRECAWGGVIFLPHANGSCIITGGAGALLFEDLYMPAKETCSQQCVVETVALNHPNARCKWAQYLLQEHAAGVCLIQNAGGVVYSALEPSEATCASLCTQFQGTACAWAEDNLLLP